jgi:hypothetical protein
MGAAQIAIFLVLLLRLLEKASYAREWRSPGVSETVIESGVDFCDVGIDDLQSEILFVLEVMVEGSLGGLRRREQGLNAETIVALLEQHAETRVDQALLGRMNHFNILDFMPWTRTIRGSAGEV